MQHTRKSDIQLTIAVEGANPQALAAVIIRDIEERYPQVRAALLEGVTVYAEEVTR